MVHLTSGTYLASQIARHAADSNALQRTSATCTTNSKSVAIHNRLALRTQLPINSITALLNLDLAGLTIDISSRSTQV